MNLSLRPSARAAVLACLAALTLAAQTPVTSAVEGSIVDGNNLPVASAPVSVVEDATGIRRGAASDAQGEFHFAALRPGEYTLHVGVPGFSSYDQSGIALAVGQTVRLAVKLVPARVRSQITVTSAPSPLDPSQVSVTTAVDHERIEELPVRSRNALDFVLLAPGVSVTSSGQSGGGQNPLGTSGFTFGGLRARSNNISIDGLDNNDEFTGASRTELSPEIVSEFQIVNNGVSAAFGGASGGSINVVTRSGADQMHGDAFVFAQNAVTNARQPVENEPGKADLSRYRTGFSNGGAIRKDRTFYYAAIEQEAQRGQEDSIVSPDAAAALNALLAGGTFPKIAARVLNPGFFPAARAETEASARLDEQLDTANSLAVRYSFTNNREASQAFNTGGLSDPSAAGSSFLNDQALAGSWLSSFSAASDNDLRLQVARRRAVLRTNDASGPEIDIDGLLSFGRPYAGNDARTEDHYEVSDVFSHSAGSHLWKMGGVVNRVHLAAATPDGFGGVYVFPSLPAFFGGQPDFYLQTFGDDRTDYPVTSFGGFVEDHWSANRKLTLDLGLRYDFERLPAGFRHDTDNFSPRAGFAYSPDARWVVRGGFGLFFDRYTLANLNRAVEVNGTAAFQQVATGAAAAAIFARSGGGPASAPSSLLPPSLYRPEPGLSTPYSAQANFSVQRQLSPNLTASVTYLFVRGIKLARTRNINLEPPALVAGAPLFGPGRIDGALGNIYQLEDAASSTYHGVSFVLNRRLANDIEFSANYTFSKAIDDASDYDEQPQNPYNLRAGRGLSRFDQKHRLAINGTFDLPIGDEDAPAGTRQNTVTRIFKNIELAPIVTLASGQPLNVLTGLDSNRSQAWPLASRPPGFGRNTLLTPATATVDLRVLKFFPVGEHAHLDVVAEAFNLLNHSNITQLNPFFGPGITPLPGFGTPVLAASARQIQFSLDFEY